MKKQIERGLPVCAGLALMQAIAWIDRTSYSGALFYVLAGAWIAACVWTFRVLVAVVRENLSALGSFLFSSAFKPF